MPTHPLRSKARFTCDRSVAETSDCSNQERSYQRNTTEMIGPSGNSHANAAMQITVATCMTREMISDRNAETHGDGIEAGDRSNSTSWQA